MDFESYQWTSEGDEDPGIRLVGRIIARIDGETHIYQFPPSESDHAVAVVKEHVEEGRLHPYAGVLIAKMIRELGDVS